MNTETQEAPKTETALTLKHAMLSTEFKPTEASRFLDLIDEEVIKEVCDVTTKKGQARERSLSAGISSFKVHMNKLALASIEEQMKTVKSTKAYLKEFNENCDERRDKRKAATLEFEAKEQARKDAHRNLISGLEQEVHMLESLSIEELESRMSIIEKVDFDSLEEFKEEGARVAAKSISLIAHRINAVKEQAKQAAELERLKKVEAEALAAKEKLEREEADRKAEAARVEAEKALAIKVKEEAEAERKRQEEAEAKRKEQELKRIEEAKAEAIKAERERIEKEQAEIEAEKRWEADQAEAKRVAAALKEAERKADEDHRRKVRYEASDALQSQFEGMTPNESNAILDAIEKGQIPNVTLNF